jgi:hypothetical protein
LEVVKMDSNYNVELKGNKLVFMVDLNNCKGRLSKTGRSLTLFSTGSGRSYIPIEDEKGIEYGLNISLFTTDDYLIEQAKVKNTPPKTKKDSSKNDDTDIKDLLKQLLKKLDKMN